MQAIAKTNQVRVSTRKIRLVADSIRSLSVDEALEYLVTMRKRGGYILENTLQSAIANAVKNANMDRDGLTIKAIEVLEGPALKRFHPSTRGRVHPYKRRSSNIKIVLEGEEKKNG